MKKFISVFMTTIILVMSVSCVNAFAQEQTKTDKWLESDAKNEIEFTIRDFGDSSSNGYHYYLKNNKICIKKTVQITDYFSVEIKIIYDSKNLYILFSDFPYFYFKYPANEITDILTNDDYSIQELEFAGSIEKEILSKTYTVEEFKNEKGEFVKYYFSEDTLNRSDFCFFDEEGNKRHMTMDIKSYNVNEQEFKIPWYSLCIYLPAL
ncbi:MAG: hypothetical protein IKW12_05160 [Clostridia bacterium]|nr:hypothetical protein [Clostridia bacterium]